MVTARQPVETIIETAQEEVERTRERIRKGLEVILDRNEPLVGVTPKDVIYQRGTLKLYHYHPMSDEVYRVPIVLVMSLVSKPWILDLTFGQSFVQYLLAQGFDVFMIDWGVPRPEDKRLGFEDYVTDLMPDCFEHVQKATGEDRNWLDRAYRGNGEVAGEDVERILELLDRLGTPGHVQAAARAHAEEAVEAIHATGLASDAEGKVKAMAEFFVTREK